MTTYSFVDESGETRLRGTIAPAPGISDPITTPLNVATTDANTSPLVITLPAGFAAGSGVAFKVVDEHGLTLYEQDADGSIAIISAAGEIAAFGLYSADFSGAITMEPGKGSVADARLELTAPDGKNAAVRVGGVGGVQYIGSEAVGFWGNMTGTQQVLDPTTATAEDVANVLLQYGLIRAA